MSPRFQSDRPHVVSTVPSTSRVTFRLGGVGTDAPSVCAAREPSTGGVLWVADLSQVWAGNRWLYFGFVLDRSSGRCIGSHFHHVLHADLITRAAREAVASQLERASDGLFRVDSGIQPAIVFTPRCYSAGVDFPHGARASAAEGALTRRFVAALRAAHLDDAEEDTWTSQVEAITAIRDWIARQRDEALASA